MKSSLSFANVTLELFAGRYLWIPEFRLLCASDLHFEKGSFFSQFATLLPPYDSQEILEKLSIAVQQLKPDIFIALGDSFHDKFAGNRLSAALKTQLNLLVDTVPQWIWITGNHDDHIDHSIKGERRDEALFCDIYFRHIVDVKENGFEITGHFHPKVGIRVKGQRLVGPCFVKSGKRLIMPSFGGYTGGMFITSSDFIRELPDPIERIFLSYQGRVHSLHPSLV